MCSRSTGQFRAWCRSLLSSLLILAVSTTGMPRLAPGVAVAAGAGGKRLDGVVNLNTAPAELLGLLPGIGPSKARGILAYRQRRPFRTVDELVRVAGIGRRMVRDLRPHLAVAGPSTAHAIAGSATPPPAPPAPPPRPPASPPACRPTPLPSRLVTSRPRPERDARLLYAPANHCPPPA